MNNIATQEPNKGEVRPTRENQPQQQRSSRGWLQPQVNILENKDGYTLEAEMPGVSKEGLEVLLEGNELTIIGRRSAPTGELQPVYRESYDRDYRRSFELDPAIDTKKITARIENGVLTLELPKAEENKPRKITVE
ncbi:MAG: Hsp20/alpha crystallin family protein [Verrucomicrobiota bacterium]